jgi:hypothetical protein
MEQQRLREDEQRKAGEGQFQEDWHFMGDDARRPEEHRRQALDDLQRKLIEAIPTQPSALTGPIVPVVVGPAALGATRACSVAQTPDSKALGEDSQNQTATVDVTASHFINCRSDRALSESDESTHN